MKSMLATMRTAIADGWANRGSFALQMTFMIANDITWVLFWGLFFHRVGTLRGWTLNDVYVMFSVVLVSAGIAVGLFPNCRRIGHLAADGHLDETLVLPTAPLPHLLCRRLDAANVGDLVFGFVVFALAGNPTPARTAVFLVCSIMAAAVLVSFLVIVSSLTLFTGGRGEQADLGLNAIVMFASYPLDLFGGVIKVLLFTLIPAAFISGIPVALIRHFDPGTGAAMAAVTGGLVVAAFATFRAGLRHYSSGSLWQR